MASPSHPFRVLGALLVAGVLAPVGLLGVAGAISETGPIRLAWAACVVAGLLGVGSALSTVRDVARAGREEAVRERDARARSSGELVVARWRIDRSEARTFADAEWRGRKIEVGAGAAGLFVVGGLFVTWSKDAPPWAGFAASGFVATLWLLIGLGKYGAEHARAVRGGEDVIVFQDAIVVLGSWHALAGERRLTKVELVDDALELTVEWRTRNGTAHDTIRAPVPTDARERAEEAVAYLRGRVA